MVKEILVDKYIDEGKSLIKQLEKNNFQVKSALWYYLSEPDEWRLIISTIIYDKSGARKTYKKLFDIIKNKNIKLSFNLGKITVVGTKDPLIELLRRVIQTGPSIAEIRFQNNVINNYLIEDALIYRVQ